MRKFIFAFFIGTMLITCISSDIWKNRKQELNEYEKKQIIEVCIKAEKENIRLKEQIKKLEEKIESQKVDKKILRARLWSFNSIIVIISIIGVLGISGIILIKVFKK